jgi:hypothetical protein
MSLLLLLLSSDGVLLLLLLEVGGNESSDAGCDESSPLSGVRVTWGRKVVSTASVSREANWLPVSELSEKASVAFVELVVAHAC